MKKNKLIPILLLAGAGVAAYLYFKKKSAAKEIAEGVDVEPVESKTTSEEGSNEEPEESKGVKLIKTAASIYKKGKQLIKGRKRKSRVEIGPTESSSEPFERIPGANKRETRKIKRQAKKAVKSTTRKSKKAVRTAKRTLRKNKKVLTGFEF